MLSCENMAYAYGGPGGGFSLADVTLALAPGEVLGVAGRSGTGKSTLLACLAGELLPASGVVEADGVRLSAAPAARRDFRRLVGLVHQAPEGQLFARTVDEDVAFGPRNLGLSDSEVEVRVAWALDAVGLDRAVVGGRSPFSLSGGERRRVAIAGALALRPRYLLLDEPTAGLDPAARDRLLALVGRLAKEGMGVALVSHDVDALTRGCTTAALVAGGRVVASGPVRDVLGDARVVRAAGLEPAVEVELAERLRERGVPVPAGATTAAEIADAVRVFRRAGGGVR